MTLLSSPERVIAQRWIEGVQISTVHLRKFWLCQTVLSYSYDPQRPVHFETMIFGGPFDRWSRRYGSLEAAQEGHDALVATLLEQPFGSGWSLG